MREYSYHSSIAEDLNGFINFKRSLGFKYDTEAYQLYCFDRYWIETNHDSTVITYQTLEKWLKRRPDESLTSRSIRINIVKQLTLYMNGIGKKSYIPTEKYVKEHPVIHVLSLEEIQSFFKAVDTYTPKKYPNFSTCAVEK